MSQVVNLDFGKQDQNPVNDMRFFSKDNLNKAVPVRPSEVSGYVCSPLQTVVSR